MRRLRVRLLVVLAIAGSGCTLVASLDGLTSGGAPPGDAEAGPGGGGIDAPAEGPWDAPAEASAAPEASFDAPTEASPEAAPSCDPAGVFAAPTPLTTLDDPQSAQSAQASLRLSPSELTAYFQSTRGAGPYHLFTATRPKLGDVFGPASPLANVGSASDDYDPSVTSDGLTLYFASDRDGGPGSTSLYVATRASGSIGFGPPSLLSALNSSASDAQPFVTADGQELWFMSARAGGIGGADIYVSRWSGSDWGAPVDVTELDTPSDDWLPTLSADGLTIYFASKRSDGGALGGFDIWTAQRTSRFGSFGIPRNVTELNGPQDELPDWLSPDDCRLYFQSSEQQPNPELYVASRQ